MFVTTPATNIETATLPHLQLHDYRSATNLQNTTTTTTPASTSTSQLAHDVIDNIVLNSTRATGGVVTSLTTSGTGVPDEVHVIFLWLPYIIFTIALLALICCSFLRFHSERGVQFRRRQEELNDKIRPSGGGEEGGGGKGIQDGGLQLLLPPDTTADEGGSPHNSGHSTKSGFSRQRGSGRGYQPNGGTIINSAEGAGGGGGVPEHITFAEYTQVIRHNDRYSKLNSHDSGNYYKKSSLQKTSGSSRRPLVFTFNVNGSMVDVRCGEEERTNTFRLTPTHSTSGTVSRTHSAAAGRTSDTYEWDYRDGDVPRSAGTYKSVRYARGTPQHEFDRGGRGSGPGRGRDYPSLRSGGGGRHEGDRRTCDSALGGRASGVRYERRFKGRGGREGLVEREGEGEANKNSSEDEALLVWQKHPV